MVFCLSVNITLYPSVVVNIIAPIKLIKVAAYYLPTYKEMEYMFLTAKVAVQQSIKSMC